MDYNKWNYQKRQIETRGRTQLQVACSIPCWYKILRHTTFGACTKRMWLNGYEIISWENYETSNLTVGSCLLILRLERHSNISKISKVWGDQYTTPITSPGIYCHSLKYHWRSRIIIKHNTNIQRKFKMLGRAYIIQGHNIMLQFIDAITNVYGNLFLNMEKDM